MRKYPTLYQAISTAEVITSGTDYPYHVYAFGENGTSISSELNIEIAQGLYNCALQFGVKNFDIICAIAPGGHPWGLLLANGLNCDLSILRGSRTSRSRAADYIERTSPEFPTELEGRRVLLVDDVVSTGNTMIKIIQDLRKHGAEVQHLLAICSLNGGRERVIDEAAISATCLIDYCR